MSDLRADPSSADSASAPGMPDGVQSLTGTRVCPGSASGRLRLVRDPMASGSTARITREEVEDELNRFRTALERSRTQLSELRTRLSTEVGEEDARILDTHLALTKDSAFIADVENLILDDQFSLDAAIGKVVGDFDRIFRLVNSEQLRRGAADLRDVGLRVLRNLEAVEETAAPSAEAASADATVLVATELSVIDLLDLSRGRVVGVVAEGGNTATHAAVLARSLRVPTIVGVAGALDALEDGAHALLDADSGVLHVADDPLLLASVRGGPGQDDEPLEAGSLAEARTLDGRAIELTPACGSMGEVERTIGWGANEIGLYRTELSFLLESSAPSVERLLERYEGVCKAAEGKRVTFRLLQADSTTPLSYVERDAETNPALGCAGVRLLREHPELLRAQLSALLRLGSQYPLRIAIPFVDDLEQFAFVRDALVAERLELSKRNLPAAADVEVGVVLDTPAALLGLDTLCEHADFLIFHLDSLTQYVLAADRSQPRFAAAFERLHPYLLRALSLGLETVTKSGVEFAAAGSIVERPENLAHLVGLGFNRLCAGPHALPELMRALGEIDTERAAEEVDAARRAPSAKRERSPVHDYRHGFA
ncbi:MAG: putative PEP-binding protein [Planctomycetota bacterium]